MLDTPGLAAFWDFSKRETAGVENSRFCAWQPRRATAPLCLDALNYVRDFWNRGPAASYADFPLLGRGPFGQAVRFRQESDPDFRPVLAVPRTVLHDSAIDVKGPGRSVSMVVWAIRESGRHALAGIWHEGTDLESESAPVTRVQPGRRQYALFAGLAANYGASAVHVSENGAASFGDRYARNLAVTPELIPTVPADSLLQTRGETWSVVGFTFDNAANTITAYLDGVATEYWIDNPREHPFFRWPYQGWKQARLHAIPGLQEGEDPAFPTSQFFQPPEQTPLSRTFVSESETERVEIHAFPFTRVQVTLQKDANGLFTVEKGRDLKSLRANPFWFPHDLYSPPGPGDGGPFTIGRVVHVNRTVGFTGWVGGVAVFDRALTPDQMKRLASFRDSVGR